MIAAFKVLLPYHFTIPIDAELSTLIAAAGDLRLEIAAPYQSFVTDADLSTLSQTSLVELLQKLGRNFAPLVNPSVRIDGRSAIDANVIAMNLRKSHFDRSVPPKDDPTKMDPSVQTIFNLLNRLIVQIRAISKSPFVRPLNPESVIWRLDYLNDDGTELPSQEGMVRGRVVTGFQWRFCSLNEKVWTSLVELPLERDMPLWEFLYLDAVNALPDSGSAIVLAFSAVEVLISQVLAHHAHLNVKPFGIWEWLTDRAQYWREPSITDKVDRILAVLVGASLKDDQTRWETFRTLKRTRDTFVHTGEISLDPSAMNSLLMHAKGIIDWLAQYLPAEQQSYAPKYSIQVEITRRLS